MHRTTVSLMAFSGAFFLLHAEGRADPSAAKPAVRAESATAKDEASAKRDEPANGGKSEPDRKKTNDPDARRKADGAKTAGGADADPAGKRPSAGASDAKKTTDASANAKRADATRARAKSNEKDASVKKPASASAENGAGKSAAEGKKGEPAWTKSRPGVVKLVRNGETLEVRVLDRRQKLVPATLPQFARFLRSKSGADHPIDARLVTLVATVSDHFGGREVNVVSGFRPYSPNQYSRHSNHNEGRAIDFSIKGIANETVRDYCRTFHNVGVGYYPNSLFVHLDVRDSNAYWVDYAAPGQAPRYRAPDSRDDDDDVEGVASVDSGAAPVHIPNQPREDIARGKNAGRGGDGDPTGSRGVFVTR
jgi:uncharacterized protein YcbK (DUF882 family)